MEESKTVPRVRQVQGNVASVTHPPGPMCVPLLAAVLAGLPHGEI